MNTIVHQHKHINDMTATPFVYQPTNDYFDINYKFNPAWHCFVECMEKVRRWSDGKIPEPQPVNRIHDLGYEGRTMVVALDDAAIMGCAPLDRDLLDRLCKLRIAIRNDPARRFYLELEGNLEGAKAEVMQVNMTWEDAVVAASELNLAWRKFNPGHGFGSTRFARASHYPFCDFVLVLENTVRNYNGSSGVAKKYLQNKENSVIGTEMV